MYEITSYQELETNTKRIISNYVYSGVKEKSKHESGGWRHITATFNAGFAKSNAPSWTLWGHHFPVDSPMVQQKLVETDDVYSVSLLWLVVEPDDTFKTPPYAVQLYKAAYDDYLTNLPVDELETLYSVLESRQRKTIYRKAHEEDGLVWLRLAVNVPESLPNIFDGVMERCNFAILSTREYNKYKAAIRDIENYNPYEQELQTIKDAVLPVKRFKKPKPLKVVEKRSDEPYDRFIGRVATIVAQLRRDRKHNKPLRSRFDGLSAFIEIAA